MSLNCLMNIGYGFALSTMAGWWWLDEWHGWVVWWILGMGFVYWQRRVDGGLMEVWLFGWVSLVASRGRSNSSKCGKFWFFFFWGGGVWLWIHQWCFNSSKWTEFGSNLVGFALIIWIVREKNVYILLLNKHLKMIFLMIF